MASAVVSYKRYNSEHFGPADAAAGDIKDYVGSTALRYKLGPHPVWWKHRFACDAGRLSTRHRAAPNVLIARGLEHLEFNSRRPAIGFQDLEAQRTPARWLLA